MSTPTQLRHPLERGVPPAWADSWGHDQYGIWVGMRVRGVELVMRWIPPGPFLMGSPLDEKPRFDREGPQHHVTITRGFWLGDTACTNGLWDEVTGASKRELSSPAHPVTNVDWGDAFGFIDRLNELDESAGAGVFRLPTEAEWEYACRAGRDGTGYDDESELREIARLGGNSDYGCYPVGELRRNRWGLADMLGNVWEWCADDWLSYDSASVTDPVGDLDSPQRALRGGAWATGRDSARRVSAAFRAAAPRGSRHSYVGFRLARGHALQPGAERTRRPEA